MKKGAIISGLTSVLLAACVTTQEMPLAPNVVRLDTQAKGALFVGQAPKATMKRAAEITLAKGFTHFRLGEAQMGQGRELAGVTMNTYGTGTYTPGAFGRTGYGSYSGFSTATPVMAPTSHVGVTVFMLHAGEPGAEGAFDAAAVLKELEAK